MNKTDAFNKFQEDQKYTSFPINLIMDRLDPKEAVRIAYIPVVISNAAIRYINAIADYCAKNKLPFVKEVRNIRSRSRSYRQSTMQTLQSETYKKLEDVTNDFFSVTATDLQTLYWTVNNAFLRAYPDLDREKHDLYTLIYVAHSLFMYVKDFQIHSEKRMSAVCGTIIKSDPDPDITALRKELENITSDYTLGKNQMIGLALKVISNRIDEYIFSDVEITDD